MSSQGAVSGDGPSGGSGTYAEYKNSGVEWLGNIPAHWAVRRLKHVGALQGGAGFPHGEQGLADEELPFYKVSDMNTEGNEVYMQAHENSVRAETARKLGAKVLPPDSIVFPKVGAALLSNKRRILTRHSCIDNNVMAFTPTYGDAKYWYYHLEGLDLGRLANPGAVPSVNEGQARDIAVVFPPLSEQCAVADFLDRETVKIDALIAKKARLIELLQEKRTALIGHVVTRGLDPNVPMKDSGIEWLGEIPAHWEVKPLKHLTGMINGYPFKPSDWGTDGVPIIRIENLNLGGDFNCTTRRVDSRYEIQYGDLLFGWSGNRGTSFGPFIWTGEGTHYLNQHIFKLSGYGCDTAWFYWALKGVTFYVEKQAHGIIGLVHITRKDLGLVPMPVLAPHEQRAIAVFLDRETAKIDGLIAKVGEAIDKLREYRSALISAAVTGKIDVREADS